MLPNHLANEENVQDADSDPDAFLSDGTWNKVHIRRLVHVMDMFKISNDGYHELRMTSNGLLPPIHRIKSEKEVMSKEIPYTPHPTVRSNTIHFNQTSTASIASLYLNNTIYLDVVY